MKKNLYAWICIIILLNSLFSTYIVIGDSQSDANTGILYVYKGPIGQIYKIDPDKGIIFEFQTSTNSWLQTTNLGQNGISLLTDPNSRIYNKIPTEDLSGRVFVSKLNENDIYIPAVDNVHLYKFNTGTLELEMLPDASTVQSLDILDSGRYTQSIEGQGVTGGQGSLGQNGIPQIISNNGAIPITKPDGTVITTLNVGQARTFRDYLTSTGQSELNIKSITPQANGDLLVTRTDNTQVYLTSDNKIQSVVLGGAEPLRITSSGAAIGIDSGSTYVKQGDNWVIPQTSPTPVNFGVGAIELPKTTLPNDLTVPTGNNIITLSDSNLKLSLEALGYGSDIQKYGMQYAVRKFQNDHFDNQGNQLVVDGKPGEKTTLTINRELGILRAEPPIRLSSEIYTNNFVDYRIGTDGKIYYHDTQTNKWKESLQFSNENDFLVDTNTRLFEVRLGSEVWVSADGSIKYQLGSDGKVYETGASGIPKESITHTTKADLAAHKSGVREPAPPPTNPSPDRIFVKGDQEFIINPEDGQVWYRNKGDKDWIGRHGEDAGNLNEENGYKTKAKIEFEQRQTQIQSGLDIATTLIDLAQNWEGYDNYDKALRFGQIGNDVYQVYKGKETGYGPYLKIATSIYAIQKEIRNGDYTFAVRDTEFLIGVLASPLAGPVIQTSTYLTNIILDITDASGVGKEMNDGVTKTQLNLRDSNGNKIRTDLIYVVSVSAGMAGKIPGGYYNPMGLPPGIYAITHYIDPNYKKELIYLGVKDLAGYGYNPTIEAHQKLLDNAENHASNELKTYAQTNIELLAAESQLKEQLSKEENDTFNVLEDQYRREHPQEPRHLPLYYSSFEILWDKAREVGASSASPTQTKIVFSSTDKGNLGGKSIFTMDTDGRDIQKLTSGLLDVYPQWSPDGNKILFTSSKSDEQHLYVMDANGKNQIELTTFRVFDNPQWSPDSTKILFVANKDGQRETDIYSIDLGTQVIKRLTVNDMIDVEPKWSPDGTKITFVSYRDGNYEIYRMGVDGTNQARLTNNPFEDRAPAWSPDGLKVSFVSKRDGNKNIYTINANGENPTRLTDNIADDDMPLWSPNGDKITFNSFRNGRLQIFVMDSNGDNTKLISALRSSEPSWSQDGTKIVFRAYQGTRDLIYVANADGSDEHPLNTIDGMQPQWSPMFTQIQLSTLSVPIDDAGKLYADYYGQYKEDTEEFKDLKYEHIEEADFSTNQKNIRFPKDPYPMKFGENGEGEPKPGVGENLFGIRYYGKFNLDKGYYRFYTDSDDGSRLFVNDEKVVDNWGKHEYRLREGYKALSGGVYNLRVDYYDIEQNANIGFGWGWQRVIQSGDGNPLEPTSTTQTTSCTINDWVCTEGSCIGNIQTLSGCTKRSGVICTGNPPTSKPCTTTPPANTPPVATDVEVSTLKSTPIVITLQCTDAESDPLTYSIVSPPQAVGGSLSAIEQSTGKVTFTPTMVFTDLITFTYKCNDRKADSRTATVTIRENKNVAVKVCCKADKSDCSTDAVGSDVPDGDKLIPGQYYYSNNKNHYCTVGEGADNGKFKFIDELDVPAGISDIQNRYKEAKTACEALKDAVGHPIPATWTGTKCCGEPDERYEFYNDPITASNSVPPTGGDINGGCWNGVFKRSTAVLTDTSLQNRVISNDGIFLGCGQDLDSSLKTKIDTSTRTQLLTLKDYCMKNKDCITDPNNCYLCKYKDKWLKLDNSEDISKTYAPSSLPSAVSRATRTECCPQSECWDGGKCIADQSGRAIKTGFDTSMPKDVTKSHEGGAPPLISGSNSWRCINGDWKLAEAKTALLDGDDGYCKELALKTMCLVDTNGELEFNGHPEGGTKEGKPVNPQCITNGQFFLKNLGSAYNKDNYCQDGEWTSRTKLVAAQLINLAGSADFTLFCGPRDKTLVDDKLIIDDQKTGTAQLTNEDLSSLNSNNVCVLNTPNMVAVGFTINDEVSTKTDILKKIFSTECSNLVSNPSLMNKDAFTVCKNNNLWYNPKIKALIYKNTQGNLNEQSTSQLIGISKNNIENPMSSIVQKISTRKHINFNDYSTIYIAKLGSGAKTVYGIFERNHVKRIGAIGVGTFGVKYTGLGDICALSSAATKNLGGVIEKVLHKDDLACIGDTNSGEYFIVESYNHRSSDDTAVAALASDFIDLTAKLRVS